MADTAFGGTGPRLHGAHPVSSVVRRASASARTAYSWWIGELAGMVPDRVANILTPAQLRLIVAVRDGTIAFRAVNRKHDRDLGRFALTEIPKADRQRTTRGLLGRQHFSSVKLRLHPSDVLYKSVELPAAAEPNLRDVLALDMDRQTPFRAEDVYFDAAVRERRDEDKRILVDLYVAPRTVVDLALEHLRDCGLEADGVEVATAGSEGTPPIDLMRRGGGTSSRRLRPIAMLGLGILALALFVAVVSLPAARQRQAAESLKTEMEAAREEAQATTGFREEIDSIIRRNAFIEAKKREHPQFVEVLAELTRILDDDTWLIRFHGREAELQIFGYSQAASALIGAIEGSAMFEQAAFRAPVLRDPREDAERFHIGFQITGPAMP